MWMRGKDLADLLGCCKKTAVARAQRMGLKLELRSVRGGWAHYVFIPEDKAVSMMKYIDLTRGRRMPGRPNADRLERCIALVDVMAEDFSTKSRAKLIATLYEVMP